MCQVSLVVKYILKVISDSSGPMVDLHIEGYSFSLMCWMFAMLILISFTWAVNITCKFGLNNPGISLFYLTKGF